MKRLLLLLPLLLVAMPAQAQTQSLIINEVSLNPLTNDSQWIEIKNDSSQDLFLADYHLENKVGDTSPLNGVISSSGFQVVFFNEAFFEFTDTLELWHDDILLDSWVIEEPQAPGSSSVSIDDGTAPSIFPTAGRPNLGSLQTLICEAQEESEQESSNPTDNDDTPNLETGIIYLNEIYANPDGDEATQEFVELYNPGSATVNLDQWILADATKEFMIENLVITGNSYLTLSRPQTTLALNNSNEQVQLIDPFGTVIHEFNYETTIEGKSWNYDGQTTFYQALPSKESINNDKPEEVSSSTEIQNKTTSSIPVEPEPEVIINLDPLLSRIILNEILPNPVGSDTQEWVELYNPESESIKLAGLIIKDATGEYEFDSGVIQSKSYFLLAREQSGIALNNTNESLSLIVEEVVTDSFNYETSNEGYSWARFSESWLETSVLTPGEENEQDAVTSEEVDEPQVATTASVKTKKKVTPPIQEITLSEWNKIEHGEQVQVTGIVTAEPGLLQKRLIVIQSESSSYALEIYFHKSEWPDLKTGIEVIITGEKSVTETNNRLLVRATEDIVVGDKRELVLPDYERAGHYVLTKLTGILIEQNKNELLLNVNGEEVIVNLKKAGVLLSPLLEDQTIEVIGLKDAKTTSIIPRSMNDVIAKSIESQLTISEETVTPLLSEEVSNSSQAIWWSAAGIGVAGFIGISVVKRGEIVSMIKRNLRSLMT
jgi:hypothetical protein